MITTTELDDPVLAGAERRGDPARGVELDLVELAVADGEREAVEAARPGHGEGGGGVEATG